MVSALPGHHQGASITPRPFGPPPTYTGGGGRFFVSPRRTMVQRGPGVSHRAAASPSFNVPGGTRDHSCGHCSPLMFRASPEGATLFPEPSSRIYCLAMLVRSTGSPRSVAHSRAPPWWATPGRRFGYRRGLPPRCTFALVLRLNLIVPAALLSPARGGHRFALCTPYRGNVRALLEGMGATRLCCLPLHSTSTVWADYSLRTV